MSRKRRSPKERERLFDLHGRKCWICGEQIETRQSWELEHVTPWALTRDESDDNVKPAHVRCHKEKTFVDVRAIRKADRIRRKNIGAHKSSRPMAGSRRSKFKRKMSGEVVLR